MGKNVTAKLYFGVQSKAFFFTLDKFLKKNVANLYQLY